GGGESVVSVEQDLLGLRLGGCGAHPRRPGGSLPQPPAARVRVDPGSRSERGAQCGPPRRECLGAAKRLWSGQRWPASVESGATGRGEAGTNHAVAPRGIERSVWENGHGLIAQVGNGHKRLPTQRLVAVKLCLC